MNILNTQKISYKPPDDISPYEIFYRNLVEPVRISHDVVGSKAYWLSNDSQDKRPKVYDGRMYLQLARGIMTIPGRQPTDIRLYARTEHNGQTSVIHLTHGDNITAPAATFLRTSHIGNGHHVTLVGGNVALSHHLTELSEVLNVMYQAHSSGSKKPAKSVMKAVSTENGLQYAHLG